MRLTTKGRFAVTAMIDLALRCSEGPVTLAGISERQKISLSYLEQLFGKLRRCLLYTSELRLAAFASSPPVVTRTIPFASPPAVHQDVERFYAHLERVMVASDFLDPERPRRLLPKLRRLFGRTELESDEINILRGLLDAVERKLAGPGRSGSGNAR